MIMQQVRGNAKQVTPASDFTILPWSSRCQKTEITLLDEVVSEAGTAGNPGKVSPQLPGRALVKGCEGIFIHGDARLRRGTCSRAHLRYGIVPSHIPLPGRAHNCSLETACSSPEIFCG